MTVSEDTLMINIESTSKDVNKSLDNLITKLDTLNKSLEDVVNKSGELSKLKTAVKDTSSKSIKSRVNKAQKESGKQPFSGYGTKEEQFSKLGVDEKSLGNAFNTTTVAIEQGVQETNKYRTATGKLVTVVEKTQKGLTGYKVSVNNAVSATKKGTSVFSAFTKGMSGTITKIGILWHSIKSTTSGLGLFVNNATTYYEALNLFSTTLGDKAEQASKWIEHFSEALYLDPANVMQYMGTFNSLSKGLGVSADNAYIMSKNLTQLTYDLSSFKNIGIETAFEKLQSGISGEIEPLRNVGVALSQATLQELAYSLGIKQNVADMNEASKAQLRYIQIMRSSTEWQADMGKTLTSPANMLRVIKQQFSLLGRAIGNVFIPIVATAIPYVMALTEILTELANSLAKIVGNIFGIELDFSIGNFSTGMSDITSGLGAIGDSADETTNKLNTMLAPFDDLNVVQSKSEKADSGIGSLGGSDLGIPLPEYDALSKLTDKFKNNVKSARKQLESLLSVGKKLAIVLGGIWAINKIANFVSSVGTLSTAFNKLFGGIALGNGLTKTLISRFKEGKKATGTLSGGISNVLTKTQKLTIGMSALTVGTVASYKSMKNLGNGTKKATPQLLKFGGSIGAAAAGGALLGSVIPGVGTAVGAVGGALIGATSGLIGFTKGQEQLRMEIAKKNIFGDLTISVSSFSDMLNNMTPSIVDSSSKIDLLKNSIDTANQSFKDGKTDVYNYMVQFGMAGSIITDEANEQFQTSLQSMFTNAQTIINDSTQASYLTFSDLFLNIGQGLDEFEKGYLSTISENGQWQLEKITSNQNEISSIWNTAHSQRRSLTQDEYNRILAIIEETNRLTSINVSQSQADLTLMTKKFNDDNFKITEESYNNFIKARDTYLSDQEKKNKETYANALTEAEKNYQISLEKLKASNNATKEEIAKLNAEKKKAEDKAYEQYTKTQTEYEKTAKTATKNVTKSLEERYKELLKSNKKGTTEQKNALESILSKIDPDFKPLKTSCSNAGHDAASSLKSGFNAEIKKGGFSLPTFSIDSKGKTNITYGSYATGGYPSSGEMFFAREDGIPEMVGRIGNQTAVANNDQITTSITNALISALNQYDFGNTGGPTTIYIGNKKIYEGMGDYMNSENDRYGTNVIRV